MSEATSGIPFRLYPHVATLMRATIWVVEVPASHVLNQPSWPSEATKLCFVADVPAIHVLRLHEQRKHVDARDKPGHDEGGEL